MHQHIDTDYNNSNSTFDFTEENYKRVHSVSCVDNGVAPAHYFIWFCTLTFVIQILAKYPSNYKQSGIIPLLDLAQRQNGGWLPVAAMDKVAAIVEVAPARVYEVASFYTMFNRTKVGKYFIQLCGTTPCMICGSEDIKQTIEKHLGIKNGQTTKDGLFTLLEVECLGACANAPMVQLNDDYYECLTPATTIELIEACKAGKKPPMGKWGSLPMNGQVSCEGPLGKTSLLWKEPVPPKVDPDRFKDGAVNPASVKEHMAY